MRNHISAVMAAVTLRGRSHQGTPHLIAFVFMGGRGRGRGEGGVLVLEFVEPRATQISGMYSMSYIIHIQESTSTHTFFFYIKFSVLNAGNQFKLF